MTNSLMICPFVQCLIITLHSKAQKKAAQTMNGFF